MSDAPSAPPAPDYSAAATAQGQANLDTALAQGKINNPNVNSPYGSQTVTWNGQQPTITQTLDPTSQGIYNTQQVTRQGLADLSNTGIGIAGGVLDKPFQPTGPGVQTGLDTSGVAAMPVSPGTTGYDAIMSRLNPELDRQQQQLDTQLRNQGLPVGSDAYNTQMTQFGQNRNDLETQAAAQGVSADMAANNQGYNQALQGGQFANTAQQQSETQQLQQRELPLNEITGLMSGSQIQSPTFQPYTGSNIAPPPVFQGAQAQGQAAQNIYNQQVASSNANTQGMYNIGAAGLGAAAAVMF